MRKARCGQTVRRAWITAVVLLGLTCGLRADETAAVAQIIQAAGLKTTTVAVYARDLTDDRTIVSILPDEAMIPASNMKLVTTAAALDLLGPDFVFRTTLQRVDRSDETPPDRAGAKVDLLIRGDGDPAFGDPVLLKQDQLNVEDLLSWWVQGVREAGITHVEHLIVDDRVFDRTFVHETWPKDQLNNWWCAPVAGINFYDNTLDVVPEPTTAGQAPRVRLIPEAPFLTTTNRATTSNADTFWISRKPGTNDLTFWGKVKSSRSVAIPVTVHDPPILFAQVLSHRLALAGVRVEAIRRLDLEDPTPNGRVLRTVQSPLPTVLARCNQDSQNLFAEALLKRVGYAFTGAPGSWDNGSAAVRQAIRNRLGPRAVAIKTADGSGMSRENQVTARALVELLESMHNDTRLWPVYRDSLAQGGESGTLERRFGADAGRSNAPVVTGTVYGKSGYLNGVSGLSGYLVLPYPDDALTPGRVIAFSILCNGFKPPLANYHMKAVQDQIVRHLDARFAAARSPRAAATAP